MHSHMLVSPRECVSGCAVCVCTMEFYYYFLYCLARYNWGAEGSLTGPLQCMQSPGRPRFQFLFSLLYTARERERGRGREKSHVGVSASVCMCAWDQKSLALIKAGEQVLHREF